MKINLTKWRFFKIIKLFHVTAGKYYPNDLYEEGNTPYCSASAENNGVGKMTNLKPDFIGNQIITGKVGCTAFYQPIPFCATSDVNVLTPLFDMSPQVGIFITTIINKNENYRWNYGRQCRVGDTKEIIIKLPALHNINDAILIDDEKIYSDEGYIPDFKYMEDFIQNLKYKPIKTKLTKNIRVNLRTEHWKIFYLSRLMNCCMGNGIDAITTTSDNPKYNYVSRNSNGNGVVSFVDEIEGETPFPAGAMSLALGGSFLGSCFIQLKEFYTAQNVAVLQEKVPMSISRLSD